MNKFKRIAALLGIITATCLLWPQSSEAHDCSATVQGSSRWTLNGVGTWSALEQLGVERSAEKRAIQNCYNLGYSSCFIVSAYITKCHGWDGGTIGQAECEASATARGCR